MSISTSGVFIILNGVNKPTKIKEITYNISK